jgi:hypothetical protein
MIRNNVARSLRIGWLRSALAGSLLLLAAAACGSASHSSSPAKAATSAGGPSVAPRINPSPEQVADVIAEVKSRIAVPFLPTDAYVRAFGDAACTAFDQGKTESQVRELVLQAASQLPSATISTSDADFAVRTAVSLFCPGYSARLSS